MDNIVNTIQNNSLAALAGQAPKTVLTAIQKASAQVGVNFAYLMQQASAESSFDPKAKARTSSASGLYQFIESTWLQMVKKYGHKYGMGDLADKISDKGKVADRTVKKEILGLRFDPEKAAAMAAELASDNKEYLERTWGGKAESTELYLAHFLGAGQAASFLKAHDKNPLQQAALLFPKAASANRGIFYSPSGRPKTLAEIYNHFDKKFDIKDGALPAMPAADAAEEIAEAAPLQPAPDAPVRKPAQYSMAQSPFTPAHNNRPALGAIRAGSGLPYYQLIASPVELMLLSQMDLPIDNKNQKLF